MHKQLSNITAKDSVILWQKYQGEDLMSFFSDEDWHRIFPDVFTYERLCEFFSWSSGVAFVAYEKKSHKPFAFLYVYIENSRKRIVEIHGGGWHNGSVLLHYHSLFLMLDALLAEGLKIRTACIPTNTRAYRFLRSVGFVKYLQTENYIYMWLSTRKLKNNFLYKKMMKTEQQKMLEAFAITDFIDRARWSDKNNYLEVNYRNDKMPLGDKMLTHYISYVTDRQMPFQRIWEIGGYVFSALVEQYVKGACSTENFLSVSGGVCSICSFVELYKNQDKESLQFKCDCNRDSLSISQKELLGDSYSEGKVIFRSRFVTTDYRSIYNTLYILEKVADRSLLNYIKIVINLCKTANPNAYKDDIVKRIAFGLYLLTYENIKNKLQEEESIEKFLDNTREYAKTQCKRVEDLLSNYSKFDKEYQVFVKKQMYSSKRLWCSIRDYMKWEGYSTFFSNELKNVLEDDIRDVKYLCQLELPGDVWNNNSRFIGCNFPNKSKEQFNVYLRKEYERLKSHLQVAHVEQFDVTFSLAPRMCETKSCSSCPYALINGRCNDFEKLCVNDKNKYCPIILHSTGFKFMCVGEDSCTLKSICK